MTTINLRSDTDDLRSTAMFAVVLYHFAACFVAVVRYVFNPPTFNGRDLL